MLKCYNGAYGDTTSEATPCWDRPKSGTKSTTWYSANGFHSFSVSNTAHAHYIFVILECAKGP